MTVLRIQNPDGDKIDAALRKIDAAGATIVATTTAADSWFVIYTTKEPKPRAPRQPREVR